MHFIEKHAFKIEIKMLSRIQMSHFEIVILLVSFVSQFPFFFRNYSFSQILYFFLQIESDILLRRSSSLRQGLPNVGVSVGRRKSSLEEIGISHFTTLMQATNHSNPIKISLNGSIGLEVCYFILTLFLYSRFRSFITPMRQINSQFAYN